jgi:hypothetical protein
MRSATLRRLAIALAVIGLIALAVAAMYFLVPNGKLPSALGRVPNGKGHHGKRAIAALVAGLVLLIGSGISFAMLRARRRRRSRH